MVCPYPSFGSISYRLLFNSAVKTMSLFLMKLHFFLMKITLKSFFVACLMDNKLLCGFGQYQMSFSASGCDELVCNAISSAQH